MRENVYVLGGLRSYIGVCNGMYKHIPAEILGSEVLKKVIEKYDVKSVDIDCIIGGNGVGAGGNITRLMMLEAGVDETVPAFTLDLQCGSGLESIATASAKIIAGQADLIIAGGFESSSTQPVRGYNKNHPDYRADDSASNFYSVAKFMPNVHRETVMLEGAELTAIKENITKVEMDAWVLRSHRLAVEARENKALSEIITNVCGGNKDEGIRPRMSQRLLDRMPKILPNGKLITAANACLINDGAAFVVLCSEKYAKEHDLTAQAVILGSVLSAFDPMMSPKTAVLSLQKLLKRYDLQENDIDAFEINEAFAVIDVLFARAFGHSADKYNVFGGALAYGHPYGASGAIILLHLLESLKQRDGSLGCCSVAAAGGVGTALLVQRI